MSFRPRTVDAPRRACGAHPSASVVNVDASPHTEKYVRRVPIRMKLAAALVIPLLALVVVTALEVLDSLGQARAVHEQADLATSAIGPPSLLSKIEDERNAAAVNLLNLGEAVALPVEDDAQARAATDDALTDLRADFSTRGDAVSDAYAEPLAAMDGLEEIRAEIDASTTPRNTQNMAFASDIFDDYSALMDSVFAANQQVTVSIKDSDLRRGAELIDLSARQTDLIARLVRDDLRAALTEDGKADSSPELSALARGLGQLRLNENLIAAKSEGEYRDLADALFVNEPVQQFPQLIDEVLATGDPNIIEVADAAAGDDPETFGYTVFRGAVDEQLQADASAIEREADSHLVRYLVLAGFAMVAALFVTWLVSRSITQPLRALTRQAKDMSTQRLPSVVFQILETPLGDDVEVPQTQPIVVKTRDEVGDVAKALNTVQDAAVELAVEQAVLRRNIADSFVNLGRRNQNLLGRQLDFITELESNETDPDTLASLFRLDHLATRMRRNAESLLVLAGIEPPRKWAAPVRLADVIRAALGEVEDYQRVTIRNVEPSTIMGSAAADLAHLIAEFVENALTFSPPDQAVEIRGRARAEGYSLAVIDNGFGMSADDIDQANRRLAGAESFTIAPSKYLGHYVAGNLAARHGIHLKLDPSAGTGVTATIDLPRALLTDDAAIPDRTPSHPRQASAAATLAELGAGANGNGNGRSAGRPAELPSGAGNDAGPIGGPMPAVTAASWSGDDGPSSGNGGGSDRLAPLPSLPTDPRTFGSGPALPGGPGGSGSEPLPLTPAASAGSADGPQAGGPGRPTIGGLGGSTSRGPGSASPEPGMPKPGDWFYASAPGDGGRPAAGSPRRSPGGNGPERPGALGRRPSGAGAAMPTGPGLMGLGGLTGLSGGAGSRPGAASAPAESSRTASGLTKRSRRPGESRPAAAMPNEDLLASLSRHNANLRGPERGAPMPPAPPGTPARPPLAARHQPAGPGAPGSGGPFAPGPGPAPAGRGGQGGPGGPVPGPLGAGGVLPGQRGPGNGPLGAGPGGQSGPGASPLGGGPSGNGPLGAGPGGGYGPPGQPAGGWSPTLPGGPARQVPDRGAWVPQQPTGPLLGRPGAPPVGDAAPPPAAGATTAGGLARRVRGAQMPTSRTQVNLSRNTGDAPAAPAPSAGDVYGFLTNFTEGVQRGLDDARGDEPGTPGG
jgi:signal transduction histidine kinase